MSRRREVEETEKQRDKGRGIETSDPRSVNRTKLLPKITTTTEIKGSSSPNQQKKDDYPRGQNQKNPSPGKKEVVTYGARVNQSSIGSANVWGGALDFIIKGLNAKIFQVRMEAVTQYITEKERLEIIIEGERRRVVPLKPATLERLLADFRQQRRKTANPFERERILNIIIQLENMREESYAMWKLQTNSENLFVNLPLFIRRLCGRVSKPTERCRGDFAAVSGIG